ncbi:unnamed protein product, partial [Adineta ricciae]
LPLYDGHCHVDLFFKYGFNETHFGSQLAHGRKMVLIDNRHNFQRWFVNSLIDNPNVTIFTTYGIHPKYLPSDRENVLEQFKQIFENKLTLNTMKVAIGECGIDATSKYSLNDQLFIFKFQLQMAADFGIPVVLHGRGTNSFSIILEELKTHLNSKHHVHWHCINPNSNLNIITDFLSHFENYFIGLNGSIIAHDPNAQKVFNNWLLSHSTILNKIIIETEFPFLRPYILEENQYNPISGIATTAQYIVNVLCMKNMNTTKMIDHSNTNSRHMYSLY